ncbi:MAG: serine/threonine-protein kinase [Kofleriaceae bacterium]
MAPPRASLASVPSASAAGRVSRSAPRTLLARRHLVAVRAPTEPGPPPAPARLGAFELLGEISRGGMGAVFLARHRAARRRYALKVLDPQLAVHPDLVARMADELTVSRRARHPGLLHIESFERSADGVPYLVMELLDGETLASLQDRGRLELGAVAAIGAQVASAVAALHAADVAHCDLKPDNLHVLYEEGVAGWPSTKVLDYGVARMLDAIVEDEPSIAGTPAYMAPEQWRGQPCTGSDVYALGCVLYELCVGEPPFAGTVPELMTAHIEALPMRAAVRRPSLPPIMDRLISRMLAKDAALRPTMREVARALTCFAEAYPSPVGHGEGPAWALLRAG